MPNIRDRAGSRRAWCALVVAIGASLFSSAATAATIVTTLAGTGVPGYVNGPGNVAQFGNPPMGVAADSQGNLYVPDYANNRIRKITPAGVVSTFAGNGTCGYADGTTAAQFCHLSSIAVDASNNVYVFDYNYQLVRKITPAGVVSTLAGSGTQGYSNGTGAAASFFNASDLATDAAGNIYVADTYNNVVRKVTPAGVVTTYASSSLFNGGVQGVGVDAAGNVYVSETGDHRILKIATNGSVTVFAGSGVAGWADGQGTAAQFRNPEAIAVDGSGNLYVADTNNHRIRKISPSGNVTTVAGAGTAGFLDNVSAATAQFNHPQEVALFGGKIYVVDSFNLRIRTIAEVVEPAAILKICKVAGPGTEQMLRFDFADQLNHVSVPAGPAPGGYCVVAPQKYAVGATTMLLESIPSAYLVTDIKVTPPERLISRDLHHGAAEILMGDGVTDVTFTNSRRPTGYLEICKRGEVQGRFAFTIDGVPAPVLVPAGACSPPIEVVAGNVVIRETNFPPGTAWSPQGCSAVPANRQLNCDDDAHATTVKVIAGDTSTQTIATITNKAH